MSYTDPWVEERVVSEALFGGGCECCGLAAFRARVDMLLFTDLDTDTMNAAKHSRWPPELMDAMWQDRVLLRSRLKAESKTFRAFWLEHGPAFARMWTSVPCEHCDGGKRPAPVPTTDPILPCPACQCWCRADKASMLRVRLDDVHQRILAGGVDVADEGGDDGDIISAHASSGAHRHAFANSSATAWYAVLEQLAHADCLTYPPDAPAECVNPHTNKKSTDTAVATAAAFGTGAALPELVFESHLLFTHVQRPPPKRDSAAAQGELLGGAALAPPRGPPVAWSYGFFSLGAPFIDEPGALLTRLVTSGLPTLLPKPAKAAPAHAQTALARPAQARADFDSDDDAAGSDGEADEDTARSHPHPAPPSAAGGSYQVQPPRLMSQSFRSDRRLMRTLIFRMMASVVINAYLDALDFKAAQDARAAADYKAVRDAQAVSAAPAAAPAAVVTSGAAYGASSAVAPELSGGAAPGAGSAKMFSGGAGHGSGSELLHEKRQPEHMHDGNHFVNSFG